VTPDVKSDNQPPPQAASPADDQSRKTTIGALLCPEHILLDLDVATKRTVFETAGRLLAQELNVTETEISDGLTAREQLGSTGLGNGVAFPHARMKGLTHAVAAFVRTHLPIPFNAPDEKPVSEILVLLVPEEATKQHLQILGSAARMFADRRFREQLRMCADEKAVAQLFAQWPQS
jgi:nitrogen PTS system EIIA component